MKRIILFLAFFGVLLAQAQEMDTTYVINEQGQTIGIIHEKGTIPVLPQQQPAQPVAAQPGYAVPQPMQAQPYPPQANPAFGFVDSTAYYQSIIDRYTHTANKIRHIGNGMVIGGAIATPICAYLMLLGLVNENADIFFLSYMGTLAGGAVLGTGIALKIVSNTKYRRANRYQNILSRHQMKRQYSMKLHVNPFINPINNNAGAQLALEF